MHQPNDRPTEIFLIEKTHNRAAILIRCSGRTANTLMGQYGSAVLSRTLGGYVLPADRQQHFTEWAFVNNAVVVDDREAPEAKPPCPYCGAKRGDECVNRASGLLLGHDHYDRQVLMGLAPPERGLVL